MITFTPIDKTNKLEASVRLPPGTIFQDDYLVLYGLRGASTETNKPEGTCYVSTEHQIVKLYQPAPKMAVGAAALLGQSHRSR